jgi:hypothetical protein
MTNCTALQSHDTWSSVVSPRGAPLQSTGGKNKHHEQEDGNVPGSSFLDMDQKMDMVYVDHIHHNPGTHLTGGSLIMPSDKSAGSS